jgi:bifunctional DNase/RNase
LGIMSSSQEKELLEAVDLNTFVIVDKDEFGYVGVINLFLENGKTFTMYYVPLEIVSALSQLENEELAEEYVMKRESLFDLLPQLEFFRDTARRTVKRVIIDALDESTGLYTATIELTFDTVTIQKKMIPSHAIFLARIAGKPIYVHKTLLEDTGDQT